MPPKGVRAWSGGDAHPEGEARDHEAASAGRSVRSHLPTVKDHRQLDFCWLRVWTLVPLVPNSQFRECISTSTTPRLTRLFVVIVAVAVAVVPRCLGLFASSSFHGKAITIFCFWIFQMK